MCSRAMERNTMGKWSNTRKDKIILGKRTILEMIIHDFTDTYWKTTSERLTHDVGRVLVGRNVPSGVRT